MRRVILVGVFATIFGFTCQRFLSADQAAPGIKGWTPGTGWGWVWGPDDEVGSLNAMNARSMLNAVQLVREGKVYDLGVTYGRESYKWPGHSPAEVMTFRSPEGIKRQKYFAAHDNAARTAWHSCALFMNDNVATQIDGLGHAVTGDDNHWYNGFKEADWGSDWGIRKCDGASIPPIVTPGVLIDVAGFKGVDALESNYRITVDDVKATLQWSGARLQPGDTVLIRTGTLRYWGENGSNHAKIAEHDMSGRPFNRKPKARALSRANTRARLRLAVKRSGSKRTAKNSL